PSARPAGLAVARVAMFRAGGFSSDARQPYRADAAALTAIDVAMLAHHFQADARNPLVGLDARCALIRALAQALASRPDLFGRTPARPGHLVDFFLAAAGAARRTPAARVLAPLLDGLSSIWPSGLTIEGFAVGDAGLPPAARTGDASDRIVPFHKLTQWLTYSLLEPLERAELTVERA